MTTDVAEWMMNRSVYLCGGNHGDESGESPIVEYSFQFLEDFQEECRRLPFENILPFQTTRSFYTQIYNLCRTHLPNTRETPFSSTHASETVAFFYHYFHILIYKYHTCVCE